MRIAVCDDDKQEQEQFEEALKGWDPTRSAEKFYNGGDLIEAAKSVPAFDIVFLDIYLPGENGIDIAKKLNRISPETSVVFVTVSREHAVDAFSVYAIHYLVKPVTTEGIVECFRRLTQKRWENSRPITLISDRNRYTVFTNQIYLLESSNHTVLVSLTDGRCIKALTTFKELEKNMNDEFLKLNRGILVNMNYIARLNSDVCTLQNGTELPLSIRRRAAIRREYDNFVFEKLRQRRRIDNEERDN